MKNDTRHTCIICGRKRVERKMKKVFGMSRACYGYGYSEENNGNCYKDKEIIIVIEIYKMRESLHKLKRFI